uniref:Bestrophin homolog n=1 Tax=Panagrellus redivivus TaxID=6233 RepID=A0A7E5A232_PANRE
MTVPYTLSISHSSCLTVWRIIARWRGSLWKAILPELCIWTVAYLVIQVIYRFAFNNSIRFYFDYVSKYLNTGMDSYIPMAFILGFFVTIVNNRWMLIMNNLGSIDQAAMTISAYISGDDEETRLLRRTMIRYMVLNQALVMRDISLLVRKRFPDMGSLQTAGLVTSVEIERLSDGRDEFARYWMPIQWAHQHVTVARVLGKIASDAIMNKISGELDRFQYKLNQLLKLDWIPVPLVYPQLVLLFVRMYFFICLISKQFLQAEPVNIWLPVVTMTQFVVYMGWLRVAEDMLNPLGDDDDDFECNSVIDRNLVTGLAIVDAGNEAPPPMERDIFYVVGTPAAGTPLLGSKTSDEVIRSPMVGSIEKAMLLSGVNKMKSPPPTLANDGLRANHALRSIQVRSPEPKREENANKMTKSTEDTVN